MACEMDSMASNCALGHIEMDNFEMDDMAWNCTKGSYNNRDPVAQDHRTSSAG